MLAAAAFKATARRCISIPPTLPFREAAKALEAAAKARDAPPVKPLARVYLTSKDALRHKAIALTLQPEFEVVLQMRHAPEAIEQLPRVLPAPLKAANPRLAPFLRTLEEERLRRSARDIDTNAVVVLSDHYTSFDFQRIRETVRVAGKTPLIWLRLDYQLHNPYASFRSDTQHLANALEYARRIKVVLRKMDEQGVLRTELLDDVVAWF